MNSRPLAAQLYSCFALIGFCLWLLVLDYSGLVSGGIRKDRGNCS